MSELNAAKKMGPAGSAKLMLWSIIALVGFLVYWSAVSTVEERTRGQGTVVPSQEIQVVQSLEGGILEEILVKEGQTVEQGEVLLRLSDVEASAQERGAEARFLGLDAKRARLQAEADGENFLPPDNVVKKAPEIAKNELALYESRQEELQSSYDILADRIDKASAELAEVRAKISERYQNRDLLQEELKITKDMVSKRAMPKIEQIRLERELSTIMGDISALGQRRKALEAELQVAKKEREAQDAKFRSQALGELNEVKTDIAALQESLKSMG
ncbi:MAG: biotin/lipoyl-binding protein, partial [Pseudomonadota bacterium]